MYLLIKCFVQSLTSDMYLCENTDIHIFFFLGFKEKDMNFIFLQSLNEVAHLTRTVLLNKDSSTFMGLCYSSRTLLFTFRYTHICYYWQRLVVGQFVINTETFSSCFAKYTTLINNFPITELTRTPVHFKDSCTQHGLHYSWTGWKPLWVRALGKKEEKPIKFYLIW